MDEATIEAPTQTFPINPPVSRGNLTQSDGDVVLSACERSEAIYCDCFVAMLPAMTCVVHRRREEPWAMAQKNLHGNKTIPKGLYAPC
jgi:hypothetical protein